MERLIAAIFLLVLTAASVQAKGMQRNKVQLFCHRTANRDVPENTLESLAYAARMGCDVVEIDVRRTLDGTLVLNHDDMLERLTGGMGNVELTSMDELQLLDTGRWMGNRFPEMRIPRFEEALRVAREQGIALYLDIKTKGTGPELLAEVRREGMLERVTFGGEWDDVRALYPEANHDRTESLGPECTKAQVDVAHRNGKFVVANFSETPQEIDLQAMRAAVEAGVNAINVDYPRIGAEAVGRPIEAKLNALAKAASSGPTPMRTAAIHELSFYYGFPIEPFLERLLNDSDDPVSRAAAVALVRSIPRARQEVFLRALTSKRASTRRNAAWALGVTGASAAEALIPVLQDKDPGVVKETLLALSRCSGEVPAKTLLPFLENDVPAIRGAAALALSRHQPEIAAKAVPELLKKEEERAAQSNALYVRRGKPKLTQQEIDPIIEDYREQMKLIQALEHLSDKDATQQLAAQAFRSVEDYSRVTGLVAGYQLWDRIDVDPEPAIRALDSTDPIVANRAEWVLVKAGPKVLPAIRNNLRAASPETRTRLIRILAWQGDRTSVPLLREMRQGDSRDEKVIDWAIEKITSLKLDTSM
jgi:glycerophosphoryl diester phosphodiesterase